MEVRQYKFEKFLDSLSPAQLLMLRYSIDEEMSLVKINTILQAVETKLEKYSEEFLTSDKVQNELETFTIFITET